jgi:hypothetical protein
MGKGLRRSVTSESSSAGLVYLQSHHPQMGTIPFDPPDDARQRGRHFKSSEPKATDPKSHTPAND